MEESATARCPRRGEPIRLRSCTTLTLTGYHPL
nr:MAG TPA: hypothetical protein [Caudoviricetes sp.]